MGKTEGDRLIVTGQERKRQADTYELVAAIDLVRPLHLVVGHGVESRNAGAARGLQDVVLVLEYADDSPVALSGEVATIKNEHL